MKGEGMKGEWRMEKRVCHLAVVVACMVLCSCAPEIVTRTPNTSVPMQYGVSADTLNSAMMNWREYYHDSDLVALIDSALVNNQELNIILQEIDVAQNEVEARRGEFLPQVDVRAGASLEKSGMFTRNGAVEENVPMTEGRRIPSPLPDFGVSANVSWEVDVWKRLRNSTKSAATHYLATVEGTRYMITNLVSEVAVNYYELMALDNLLDAIDGTIDIQKRALDIIRQQKQAAQATELAVKKFEAEVLKNESKRYEIQQQITLSENRINFLVGRFPQHVNRSSQGFLTTAPDTIHAGVPPQLLNNRPDIHRAEYEVLAMDLDISAAKAQFYPALNIRAGAGYQAFSAQYFFTTPESMIYSIAGELLMPIINRKAIEAAYQNASARQRQAVYEYERVILNAYIEVANNLAAIENTQQSYTLKSQQVDALINSIDIANRLFLSARADYMEVLLTQRDALEARMELIETKVNQMRATVMLYKALGGGWR